MARLKVVLITGASGESGRRPPASSPPPGTPVVNYHRSEAAALALVDELTAAGHTALAVKADVSDAALVRNMVDNVLEIFCQLDILVDATSNFLGGAAYGDDGGGVAEGVRGECGPRDPLLLRCPLLHPRLKAGKIITVSSM